MEIGIVGLPNVGKTSLFNLLTKAKAQTGNFPFTTIEPNVGVAVFEDERLKKLGEIFQPEKLTPAVIKFVDVAGLIKDSHKGEGLGNKFLSHIRPLEVLLQVLREFNDDSIPFENLSITTQKDIVETELLLADLEYAYRVREKLISASRGGDKIALDGLRFLNDAIEWLNSGKPLRNYDYDRLRFKYDFLTDKPIFYVVNSTAPFNSVDKFSGEGFIYIDVKLETELLSLDTDERIKLLKEYEIKDCAVDRVVSVGKSLLKLVTFYTVVGKEVRAWNIKEGSTALSAAAMIHSDMARGFIRADVYNFTLLEEHKTEKKLHELGLIRSEGKNYQIKDGDIIRIHFR